MSRKVTNKILELIEEGALSYEQVAMSCLRYMSEDDVADMAHSEELIPDEEEENDEEEEEE